MPDVDPIAVLIATLAAFVVGGAYYGLLGEQLAELSEAAAAAERPEPWKLAVEVLRCLILAAVVAGIAAQGKIDEWAGGLVLGLALWVGFPLVLWVGAIIHENVSSKLAIIHAGDWLGKLIVVGVLISVIQ